jgi:hypothetical protein
MSNVLRPKEKTNLLYVSRHRFSILSWPTRSERTLYVFVMASGPAMWFSIILTLLIWGDDSGRCNSSFQQDCVEDMWYEKHMWHVMWENEFEQQLGYLWVSSVGRCCMRKMDSLNKAPDFTPVVAQFNCCNKQFFVVTQQNFQTLSGRWKRSSIILFFD